MTNDEFMLVWEKSEPLVRFIIWGYFPAQGEIEEIKQELLVRCWVAASQGREMSPSYIKVSARNLCIDRWRMANRWGEGVNYLDLVEYMDRERSPGKGEQHTRLPKLVEQEAISHPTWVFSYALLADRGVIDLEDNPEESAREHGIRDEMRQVIDDIAFDSDRIIMQMALANGGRFDAYDVAERFGITHQAAKSRVYKARQRLRVEIMQKRREGELQWIA